MAYQFKNTAKPIIWGGGEKINRNGNDDEPFNPFQNKHLNYSKRVVPITQLSVHIDEDVAEPDYYREIVEELEHLNELDTVTFRINTDGGYISGLVSLVEAIRMTDAQVLGVITGKAHSAGSMLALSCPNIIVSPYATMMIHTGSYGTGGKESDVLSHVLHEFEYAERLIRTVYDGFLTDPEIDAVINGKDFWMQAPEIEARLIKRKKYRTKLVKDKTPRNLKKFMDVSPMSKLLN